MGIDVGHNSHTLLESNILLTIIIVTVLYFVDPFLKLYKSNDSWVLSDYDEGVAK